MSVLKKFFEMALLLTLILFCINGVITLFGNTFIPDPSLPIVVNTLDQNGFIELDSNGSFILQAASLGTRPVDTQYIVNGVLTLAIGFQIKLIALLSVYGLGGIGLFIGAILTIIQVIGIIYLGLAAIGTPLGGSVP